VYQRLTTKNADGSSEIDALTTVSLTLCLTQVMTSFVLRPLRVMRWSH